MARLNFTFKDNSTIILGKLDNACMDAAKKMCKELVDAVQYKMLYGYDEPHGPDGHTEIVETGRLFDSIQAAAKKVSQNAVDVVVGTDVFYAVFVHNGTRKLKGRPFISDAMRESADKLRDILSGKLRNA